MMAHDLRLDHIDHFLGDIGRVVSDTLQMARDQKERNRTVGGSTVPIHILGDQLAGDEITQSVRLSICKNNFFGHEQALC